MLSPVPPAAPSGADGSARGERSLKRRLLVRLAAPLFIIIAIGLIDQFMLARHVGNGVYDHWLYDSAMTLAGQIKFDGEHPTLELPSPAIEMFEWDSVDRIYNQVVSRKDGLIFGNTGFPPLPSGLQLNQPHYYNGEMQGTKVRVVAIMLPNPVDDSDVLFVRVAETTNKRKSLAREALNLSVPLQLAIFLITCSLVWMAIRSSLSTLNTIARHLAKYEPTNDTPPISDLKTVPLEIKPFVRSLNEMIGRLAEAQNSRRRFVNNAAHQLRTPLATLQVQTERALRESDPKQHSAALSDALNAVANMRRVVHQLLVLARSERADEHALNMAPVDLAALARDELERWADAAIGRDIDLGYDGPDEGIIVRGEARLLREMIGNLTDNAIRYGRAGGEVTLGLATRPTRLYIDDDGPGIPPQERALVLERFYRCAGAEGEGCGLGLAIASEIAERHRARLHIVDRPGTHGTRIEVVFEPS